MSCKTPRPDEHHGADGINRRATLTAIARFAASVAPVALVLLDARTAKAKQACSQHHNPNDTNCIP